MAEQTNSFDNETMATFKEAFEIVESKDNDKVVESKDLVTIMSSLGK